MSPTGGFFNRSSSSTKTATTGPAVQAKAPAGTPAAPPRPLVPARGVAFAKPEAEGGSRVLTYLRLHWLTILFLGSLIGAGLAYAAWTLVPDKADDLEDKPPRYGVFVATLVAFFLVEIGDKKPDGTVAMQPRVVPGCQTPVKDGSVVVTDDVVGPLGRPAPVVRALAPASPADVGGMCVGDFIRAWDGAPVATTAALRHAEAVAVASGAARATGAAD